MARIVIGEGLWSTIRGYLNSMFTELYAAIASAGGGDAVKYEATIALDAGVVTRVTTTITTEPYSVMVLDSTGKIVGPHLIDIQLLEVGGVYVLDIYSADALSGLTLKIIY
jgi:N-acetylglucosamine-6-phosphate deacetylase